VTTGASSNANETDGATAEALGEADGVDGAGDTDGGAEFVSAGSVASPGELVAQPDNARLKASARGSANRDHGRCDGDISIPRHAK